MRTCRAILITGVLATVLVFAIVTARAPVVAFILVGLIAYKNRRALTLHAFGTARWATVDEMKKAGMLGNVGLCVGVVSMGTPKLWASLKGLFDRTLPPWEACRGFVYALRKRVTHAEKLRLNRAVHVAVFAPTGAGKGVSLVLPFLLENRDSVVVIDPKGENAKLTAEKRRAMGQKVVLLDPFKVATQTPDCLNPLAAISTDSPTALDDCRAIANQLVQRTGSESEPHWNDVAESMITTLVAATLFMDENNRNLQTVRTLLTDSPRREAVLQHMTKLSEWDGMLARLANQALNYKDKELAGVLSTANRHLTFLDTLPVAASTRTSSFDPCNMPNTSVYLVLPPQYLKSHSGLLRLWVGALLRGCVQAGLQEERKTHFVLDEAASLGKLDMLQDAVDKLRAYGVRCQFYYQDMGQLKTVWRDGLDKSLLSNTTQVFFAVNDQETAEYVSNRLGEETVTAESWGTNSGGSTSANTQDEGGSLGNSWGRNTGLNQHARKLLKPEEVAGQALRTAITFTPGMPPIASTLIPYYAEAPQSPWQRMKTKAEVWAAAFSLAALSLMGLWLVVFFKPR
jgi:type IV secretion system protein VirD4